MGRGLSERDTAELLGVITALSGRPFDDMAVHYWAEALDPRVTLETGQEAILQIYGDPANAGHAIWITPADINARAKRIRRSRQPTRGQIDDWCEAHRIGATPAFYRRVFRLTGDGMCLSQAARQAARDERLRIAAGRRQEKRQA